VKGTQRVEMDWLGDLASTYDQWITERPTEAKLTTSVSFNLIADATAQCIAKAKGSDKRGWGVWDALPPLRLVIWGLLSTPIVDRWLEFLDSTFGHGTDVPTLLKKLSIDQLLFGPWLLALFLVYVGAFDSVTTKYRFRSTFDGLGRNVVHGTLAGIAYWLPVTICMFTLVPRSFRLLLLSVTGLVYNTFLSLWVSGQASERDKKKEE